MADAVFTQNSFLGGEWSPYAQGRSDLPQYRTGMKTCQNAIPIEEGAWVRRQGFAELGPTYMNRAGLVRRFELTNNTPVALEFTFGSGVSGLRFWFFDSAKYHLTYNDSATVTSFSAVSPSVMTISGAAGAWNTGDIVYFLIDPTIAANIAPQLANRQFIITKLTATTYSLVDMFTGANLDGTIINGVSGLGSSVVRRVQVLTPSFTSLAELQSIDVVQADTVTYLLSSARLPQLLTLTQSNPPLFTLADAGFAILDGPYLDPLPGLSQQNNSIGQLTAPSAHGYNKFPGSSIGGAGPGGTIVFQILDGAYSFTSADVGRPIRLWSQPPTWNSSTTYANGDCVTWNGAYWKRNPGLPPSVGQDQPGQGVAYYDSHTTTIIFPWALVPSLASWCYGSITSFTNSSTVGVTLAPNSGIPNWSAAGPITDQGNGPTIDTWQIGAFTAGHFPSCGTYHEGRLWLSGAYSNRFDASKPLSIRADATVDLQFAPSDLATGQVLASSGINYTLRSPGVNNLLWMIPDHQGILCGTQQGEWLIQSSNLSNPLTPSDIQAKRSSQYKCGVPKPLRVGTAIIFVQASARRVMEYIADVFSGKFIARHLNKFAKHLGSVGGFKELAYQEESAPIVWACDVNNTLYGCTYRRKSQFGSEDPEFTAWHRHPLQDGATVRNPVSLCSLSNNAGLLDTLAVMTKDGASRCYIGLLASIPDPNDPFTTGKFLDFYYSGNGGAGLGGGLSGYDRTLYVGGGTGLKINGMAYKAGQTVAISILGLYCGSYVTGSDGSIVVPYQSDPDGLLTPAYIAANSQAGSFYGETACRLEVNIASVNTPCTVPIVVGTPYTSIGQILPPETQQETRGQNGPALGKIRRVHRWAAKFVNTVGNQKNTTGGLKIGTDPAHLLPIILYQADDQTPLNSSSFFTGATRNDILDDDYSVDGSLYWQVTDPYPCTISEVACFLDVVDES